MGGPPTAGGRNAQAPGLLCVANFPTNTGYAWEFIEGIYAALANELHPRGIRSWVAYPDIVSPPNSLHASHAVPVELEVDPDSVRSVRATLRFLRAHRVRVMYLPDFPAWHPAYALYRRAGVKQIIVHDHTSGERTIPRGWRRLAKRLRYLLPGMMANQVVAVSDYVARRKVEADLIPASRVRRIWNSVSITAPNPDARDRVRKAFGLAANQLLIACACRATAEKGIAQLLRAFDRLVTDSAIPGAATPVLLFMGDGPAMADLHRLRQQLPSGRQIVFAGYRSDAVDLMEGADLCVVPSLWQEGFGLAALEPMSRGVPVIATRVGGIPEIVVHEETGLLVPAGDERMLEAAMLRLLFSPSDRMRMGANGRRRAESHFSHRVGVQRLTALLEHGFVREIELQLPRGSASLRAGRA